MKKTILLLLSAMAIFFAACVDEPIQPEHDSTFHANAVVLNEGSWGGNNAELSFVDTHTGTIRNSCFGQANGRGLGDLGQDAICYGAYLYVVVHNSGTIEVVDTATGKSLKQINLSNKGPRHIVGSGGNVYVTCYDKTIARIDTTSLSLTGSCALSRYQPEGICAAGSKLYVCNSWQYAANGEVEYDNTISVIDIASFTETHLLTVPTNPTIIRTLANGLIVIGYGNGYYNTCGTALLDPVQLTLTNLDVAMTNFDVSGNNIYGYNYNYSTLQSQFWKINAETHEKVPILQTSTTNLINPYSINVDPSSGNIYICDARNFQSNGDVYCFSPTGALLWSDETTIGPSKVVVLNH